MPEIKVILVDEQDKEIGQEEKLKAHQQGLLHRAFSVFIFNSRNQLLLQKRAKTKYHSPGLWSNTCCGHPLPGEDLKKSARKRLIEEMGFNCELKEVFSFIYKTEFLNQLVENEYDHVFSGRYGGEPILNLNEAEDWRWADISFLKEDIEIHPEKYAFWFKISLNKFGSGDDQADNFFSSRYF